MGLVRTSLSSPLHFFTADQLNTFYASVSNLSRFCLYAGYLAAVAAVPAQQLSFSLAEITSETVLMIINLSPLHSYSSGPDRIPLFCISKAFPCNILTKLFNYSFRLSYFPSHWKRAYIRPLLKIRSPLSPSDTRPIADLSELSKILERVVHLQVTRFISENNLLDQRQSGYRSGYSTQSALLRVGDDIRSGIDYGLITILILFDFSKAFDTVSHVRLLMKLKSFGFSTSTLDWFFSYLVGRSQAIVDESYNRSRWLCVTSGVPQGSVLGPLLFSLFINDIGKVLKHSHHMIFADDTQIYLSCLPSRLNHGLEKIAVDASAIFQ